MKGIRTTARREGDAYVLDGTKLFITNGVHADLVCVAAKTGGGRESRAVTMFLVEKGTPGFRVGRALDSTAGAPPTPRSSSSRIAACPPRTSSARRAAASTPSCATSRTSGSSSAPWRWARRRALELTLDWVRSRKAFGSTLWDKQATRQKLAMLAAKIEAGRQLVYATAWRMSRGEDCTREVSMAKAYCGELVNEVLYDCVQCHGGMRLHARHRDRAHGAGRARPGDRRRRDRGDARGGGEAALRPAPLSRPGRGRGRGPAADASP